MSSWTTIVAAFLASLVEFVEALTIVLAVGTVRGWRSALLGAAGGAAVLALLVASLGPSLARAPLHSLQLVIGVLLLLFGMRWLRKAVLRAAGVVALHDEAGIYAEETELLRRERGAAAHAALDVPAALTALKAVLLEGVEVVFIVIAAGAGGRVGPAALGAAAAGLLVIGAGFAVRHPLSRVPENLLKYAVGLLLSAFGVFWIGEGLGFPWPAEDLSLPALVAALLAVSLVGVVMARRTRAAPL
jgi:uncharacterized membrane protein